MSSYYMLIIFALFIGVFYFMAIRPQQKQRKAHQEMMSSLKKGDQVMTSAGIYGTVKRVDDQVVVIEIAKGVTMKVVRRAVADIIRDPERAKALAPEGSTAASSRSRAKAKAKPAEDLSSDEADDSSDSE